MERRNTIAYGLAQSLFKQMNLDESSSPEDLISEIWSVAATIIDLSVKINNFEYSDLWNLSLSAMFNMRNEMNNYDFYLRFSDDIMELLLSVSGGDRDLVLDHLTNHVWSEAPDSPHHRFYRAWITEILKDKSARYKKYIPVSLPKIKLSLPKIKLFSRSTDSVQGFHPGNTRKAGPSDSQRGVQSVSSDSDNDPKTEYGQIFIEETTSSNNFNYEISVSGGLEGGNPYISSSFLGF